MREKEFRNGELERASRQPALPCQKTPVAKQTLSLDTGIREMDKWTYLDWLQAAVQNSMVADFTELPITKSVQFSASGNFTPNTKTAPASSK